MCVFNCSLLRGREGHTSQHPNVCFGFRGPNIGREFFGASSLNLKNIPYNSNSHETLDEAHVKCLLSKGVFISKTVSAFVQKVGLIWLKGGFYFSYSEHKCNCWLKIVNHLDRLDNGVTCTGKEINHLEMGLA